MGGGLMWSRSERFWSTRSSRCWIARSDWTKTVTIAAALGAATKDLRKHAGAY